MTAQELARAPPPAPPPRGPARQWGRDTNEDTTGLIRQYLPKGSCFRDVTQADCDMSARELTDRPRERLGFRTPTEVLFGRS